MFAAGHRRETSLPSGTALDGVAKMLLPLTARLSVSALRAGVAIGVSIRANDEVAAGYFTAARGSALLAVLAGLGAYQAVARRVGDTPMAQASWCRWMILSAATRSLALGIGAGLLAAAGFIAALHPVQLAILVATEGVVAEVGRWQIATGRFARANALMLLRTTLWTVPMLVDLGLSGTSQRLAPWLNLWIFANIAVTVVGLAPDWRAISGTSQPGLPERKLANVEAWRLFGATACVIAIEGLPVLIAQQLPIAELAALGLWLSLGGLMQTVYSSMVWERMLPRLPTLAPSEAMRQAAQEGVIWGALAALGFVAGHGIIRFVSPNHVYAEYIGAPLAIVVAQLAWIGGQIPQAALFVERRDTESAVAALLAALAFVTISLNIPATLNSIALAYLAAHLCLAVLRWSTLWLPAKE